MRKNKKIDVKALTVCSLLAAMGVICKALLSINITLGSTLLSRLGVHLLFVYLVAITYGPLLGAITGGIIDLLGTLVEGLYPINPAYTVTLALTGAAIWVVYNTAYGNLDSDSCYLPTKHLLELFLLRRL